VEELAKLAQSHRQFRYWALIALASLNESACRNCLADMLESPDAELRYGAFVALRLMGRNEREGADGFVAGRRLGSFWLHRVAPGSAPLIHMSLKKREEIVLFGNGIELRTPAGISAGMEFTITAGDKDNQCTVSRVPLGQERRQLQTSLNLEDILWKLAELGAQYPDIVDFLRKADQRGCLSCPLRIDATLERVAVEALTEI
jgi:hypothetical protein